MKKSELPEEVDKGLKVRPCPWDTTPQAIGRVPIARPKIHPIRLRPLRWNLPNIGDDATAHPYCIPRIAWPLSLPKAHRIKSIQVAHEVFLDEALSQELGGIGSH